MIVVAIIVAGLAIALAGGILNQNRQKRAEDQAEKAAAAALTSSEALKASAYVSMAAPGLEKETAYLTDHLGAFETIVDPVTDLFYAKKLTGEVPATLPPGAGTPVTMTPELLEKIEAALGAKFGEPEYKVEYDLILDGRITIADIVRARIMLTEDAETEALQHVIRSGGGGGSWHPRKSGVDPQGAAEVLAGQATSGMAALALAHTPGIIAEAASLGQMESVIWTIMDLTNATGLPDIVKRANLLPHEIGILTPARYHYNQVYRPVQPRIQDLTRMLARGQITAEDYLLQAGYEGHDGRWAAAYWNIFLRLPDFRELQPMLWRGLIDDVGFKETLLRQGWHPDVVDEMLNLAWQIPGPGDLIKFVVREVISPAEFIEQMEKQGFGPGYAGAFWTAHFRLPSPRDLIDAFHRGKITDAELQKYFFWHDYMPEPRPGISVTDIAIYRSLTKTLIPRVDLRRAWVQGAINDTELEARYTLLGYEEDAELMANIQKVIALTPQRNALVRIYLAALRKGIKTESEIRAKLADLKLPAQAIDMLIEAEDIRRNIGMVEPAEEPRILSTSHILGAYKKNVFTWDVALEMLTDAGWDPSAAETLLVINTPPPETERPISQVRTAAAALYKEGWIPGEEFEGMLRAANYSEDDIAAVRLAEDLRFRMDFLNDLRATAIEAFRKDIYTEEDLEGYLLYLGMDHDRAKAVVAKEVYKKLPKPKKA